MTKLVVGIFVPLLALALAVPLILEKVPPNNTYGFRTSKTLSAPEIWYPANRVAGWFMFGAAAVSLCFNLALWRAFPEWPLEKMTGWMTGGTLIPLAIALIASFIYLRRL